MILNHWRQVIGLAAARLLKRFSSVLAGTRDQLLGGTSEASELVDLQLAHTLVHTHIRQERTHIIICTL